MFYTLEAKKLGESESTEERDDKHFIENSFLDIMRRKVVNCMVPQPLEFLNQKLFIRLQTSY